MFNDHYKKMCEMYNGLEKSTSEISEANNKLRKSKTWKAICWNMIKFRQCQITFAENQGLRRKFDSKPRSNWS